MNDSNTNTFLIAPFCHQKKDAHTGSEAELVFLFYNKYPIPDLKYLILELELILDYQTY